MNKVILLGRLTKDPEVRYTQSAEPMAVARYILAVNRRSRRQGEQEADFIPCVSFGKGAEFAEKYFRKGQMIAIVGRLQVRSWEDEQKKKHWTTEVVTEEQDFTAKAVENNNPDGFQKVSDTVIPDSDFPF